MTLAIQLEGHQHKALSPDELRAKGYRIRVRHLRYLDGRPAGGLCAGSGKSAEGAEPDQAAEEPGGKQW